MCSLHVFLCTTPVPGAHEGQLRALVPLALELRVVVNVSVGPGNRTWFSTEQPGLLPTKPSLQASLCL